MNDAATRYKEGSYQCVHREIADSLELIYDTRLNPSQTLEAIELISMSMKRMVVSYTMFHAKALMESLFFAVGVKDATKSAVQLLGEFKKKGNHPVLNQFYYGQKGDWIDNAVKGGLNTGKVDDINSDRFKHVIEILERNMEKAGFLGKASTYPTTNLYTRVHRNIDIVMWDKIMTANKLVVFQKHFEQENIRNIRLNKRNQKKYTLLSNEV